MKKIHLSNLSRVFIFLVCSILLFTLVGKPITAQASAAGTIVLGLAGGATAPVSAPVAAVCLLVVAVVGVVGANLDTIIETATSWYNESTIVQNWANSVGTQIEEGTVVVIPPDVQRYLQKKANNNKVPDNMPILFVPNSFLSLDTLTQAELVGTDVSGLLGTNNNLLTKANSYLNDLKSNILLLPSLISNALTSTFDTLTSAVTSVKVGLQTAVETMSSAIQYDLGVVNKTMESVNSNVRQYLSMVQNSVQGVTTNLQQYLSMVNNSVLGVTTTLQPYLSMTINGIQGITTNIQSYLSMVNSSVQSVFTEIRDNIAVKLGPINTTLTKSFTDLELLLKELFATGATTTPPNFNDSMNQSGNLENNLKDNVVAGNDTTIHYIGEGKDLLSKYRVAFLAVGAILTKFLDIPILSDLVVFGLALGIFALIVNLGNTIVSKNSAESAKVKKHSMAKGG